MPFSPISVFITAIAAIAAIAFPGIAGAAERPAKPNIVLLLADDLGWQDVACYDIDEPSPMETPHLDALAQKGVQFWNGYAPAPTCAPSRCAIMSGVHPARAQKTHVVGGAPPAPIHKTGFPMIDPWYSGRMPEDEFTLAKALRKEGYATGHTGKWHMAVDHHAFPQPEDQGFDFTTHHHGKNIRGVQSGMPNRLEGFATTNPGDPYRLDPNGYPQDLVTTEAIEFMGDHKGKPFFLYYATWLVHTPIQSRSKALLEKYCRKLGVDFPTDPAGWELEGQRNPYYCAMVETLDYYVGQLVAFLESTDDPRWPGHKLSENTYLIFTSDNGGMEGHPGEVITDNYPLDRGKISIMEGGTRVPLFIAGPGIPAGVQSDVVVNGLDFYPTILSWVGATRPRGKQLDGSDLSALLRQDPTDPALVRDAGGGVRDTMVWHFPHGHALESSIRIGGYKLVRNYNHVHDPKSPELELFQLYKTEDGKLVRVDIEESSNRAEAEPERAQSMNRQLTERLAEMEASYPYYNPAFRGAGPGKARVPTVLSHQQSGRKVEFSFRENGATVLHADLIYSLNGGQRDEEWFRGPATLSSPGEVSVLLPEGTTHYVLNLIDENNFLVSYPESPGEVERSKTKRLPSHSALKVHPVSDP